MSFQGYVSFRFYKLCPCHYHSTRSTYCFNTIKSSWTEIIFALNFSYFFIMWLYISFIRLVPRQILTRMVQHSMHTSQSWFCLYLPMLRPNWLVLGTSLSSLHFPIWTNYNKLRETEEKQREEGVKVWVRGADGSSGTITPLGEAVTMRLWVWSCQMGKTF